MNVWIAFNPGDRAIAERIRSVLDANGFGLVADGHATRMHLERRESAQPGGARLVVVGAIPWPQDPFAARDAATASADTTLIIRAGTDPLPEFLLPAVLPETELETCAVVDARSNSDHFAYALLRKLGILTAEPARELAEALLLQAEWGAALICRLAEKSYTTTRDSLLAVLPTADPGLCAALAAVTSADTERLAAVLVENSARALTQLRLPGNYTLLQIAAYFRNSEPIVDVLLKFGADIEASSSLGTTALYLAAWTSEKLALHLLDRGADPKPPPGILGETALHPAAWFNRVDLAARILPAGAPAFITDFNGTHPLMLAAQSGNSDIVRQILSEYPACVDTMTGHEGIGSDDPNFSPDSPGISAAVQFRRRRALRQQTFGRTALMVAAALGRTEMVGLLLQCGASPTARDKEGQTPLHYAAGTENDGGPVMELLVDAGAEVDAVNDHGDTALSIAEPQWVPVLMGLGADPDVPDKEGQTCLHRAAAWGRTATIDVLRERSKAANARDVRGFTPLHLALHFGDADVGTVDALQRAGCDLNEKTKPGRTPLSILRSSKNRTEKNKAELARRLLAHGADPWLTDDSGELPFIEAALSEEVEFCGPVFERITLSHPHSRDNLLALLCSSALGRLETVARLVEAGVPTSFRATWEPLTLAAAAGRLGVVDYLRSQGAPVDQATGVPSPLIRAAEAGHVSIVSYLLTHGADPNAPGPKGRTALFFAIENGHLDVVRELLDRNSYVNVRDDVGFTPMHLAAEKGAKQIAEILLECGANICAMDDSGDTPLHVAAASGVAELVEWLLKNGASATARNSRGSHAVDVARTPAVRAAFKGQGAGVPREVQQEHALATFLEWKESSIAAAQELIGEVRRETDDKLLGEALRELRRGRVYSAPLPFYGDAVLLAVPLTTSPEPNEIFVIVSRAKSFVVRIDWSNEPIYRSNEELALDTAGDLGPLYIKFFFFFVRGQLGRFRIVEHAAEIEWGDRLDDETLARVEASLLPVCEQMNAPENMRRFSLTCVFRDAIFKTDVYVAVKELRYTWPDATEETEFSIGELELRNEELLLESLPITIPGAPSEFG